MELVRFLKGIRLFADLTDPELNEVLSGVRSRQFSEGQVVFYKDDPGNGLYVISAGSVKISLVARGGQETLVAVMGAGECFGELAVLDGEPRSATATALERSEMLFLPREAFLTFLQHQPAVMMKIIILLSHRIRGTDDQVAGLVFFDVYGRLARTLIDLADQHGTSSSRGIEIRLPLTQQDIADLVGASRESVNKALRYFRDQGFIAMNNHRISILDSNRLRVRAEAQD